MHIQMTICSRPEGERHSKGPGSQALI